MEEGGILSKDLQFLKYLGFPIGVFVTANNCFELLKSFAAGPDVEASNIFIKDDEVAFHHNIIASAGVPWTTTIFVLKENVHTVVHSSKDL